jgi:hypothetical protein
LWLAFGIFLVYKVFSGSGDEIAEYGKTGYPETYRYLLHFWIFSVPFILGIIWIVRQKTRTGISPKEK